LKTDPKSLGKCRPTRDRQVADPASVRKLTIEMPYHIGSVHLYLFDIDGDLVLFDTGPPTDEALRCLRENIDFDRLRYVLVTHGHIDHYGLADFLQRESGAKVILSRPAATQLLSRDHYQGALTRVFRDLGFPQASAERLIAEFRAVSKRPALPEGTLTVDAAREQMDELGVTFIECPWHSQGDLVYLLGNYAITGDVALRGIFPVPLLDVNFGSRDGERFNNYRAFCLSIARLKGLVERQFLPSHKDHLDDLDGWIHFAVSKLLGRAKQVAPLRRQGQSVYQAFGSIFGPPGKDPFMAYLKTSELAFIYDFLQNPEHLEEVLTLHQLFNDVESQFSALSRAS